jgi:hypothetical protein
VQPYDSHARAAADPSSGRRAGFGTVLATILVTYAVVVAFGDSRLSGPFRVLALGLALLVAARLRTHCRGRVRLAATCAVAALVASALAVVVGADRTATALISAVVLIIVVFITVAIGRMLWRRPVADAQSVAGALAIYLLLALFFSTLHQLLAAVLGPPYVSGIASAADTSGYLYFSVITLATVGFGDITPACAAARTVTMAEALAGQLYLVAIVGAVVGNWDRPTRRARSATAGDAGNTGGADR